MKFLKKNNKKTLQNQHAHSAQRQQVQAASRTPWIWSRLQTESLVSSRGSGGSAQPFLDASDPPGQLHVLWEEGNTPGMQGEEIGVLKEMD